MIAQAQTQQKLGIQNLQLEGKRVLMRVDFNVPITEGKITDNTRMVEALPTIKEILAKGGKLILVSHLGRPDGKTVPELSLAPVATHLSQLLNRPVQFSEQSVGEQTQAKVESLKPGEVLLLENIRFHPEEELLHGYDKQDQPTREKIDCFTKSLASLGDIYVNDAFGTAHRAHVSTQGVTRHFKENAAGLLMQKEIAYLGRALASPARPFVAILGGSKVSDKIKVINSLLEKVDTLLIGGAMAYTFLKAQGLPIGNSKFEEEHIQTALNVLEKAKQRGVKIILPVDHVVAKDWGSEKALGTVMQIEDGTMALDIGQQSVDLFSKELKSAGTVLWNGPMGVFERPEFSKGTFAVARLLADSSATTIVGGGDSVSAIKDSGVADKISHISTGGGASLEFLEGKTLPGIAALSNA
jgi:phosphoglycerate kinase